MSQIFNSSQARARSSFFVAVLCAALIGGLYGVSTAAPTAHEAPASLAKKGKCGKGKKGKGKPKGCKKPKQSFDVLYGQYLGAEVAVVVGKARSGPHAGREYVQIVSGTPMAVTCSDGSTQEIYKSAAGWISGKTFKGTQSSETSESSTSGSFTSLTTIKGVYRTVSKRFGVTCETGSRHFTAEYEG